MGLIKENSKSVLEQWVNQFSDELYSWAFFKTSSKEVAEDLVQDTFLAAFHKIDSFQGKSQKNFSLTENSGYELSDGLFNSYGCWKNNDINAVWDQEQELLDNPDFNTVMEECMNDLPQKWKLAITSKYLSEKKTEAICQELEITTSNYWQIVHRSKLLLKKCLELKWV
jgi:RNA polymerase sigma factor (sigma-70 family)